MIEAPLTLVADLALTVATFVAEAARLCVAACVRPLRYGFSGRYRAAVDAEFARRGRLAKLASVYGGLVLAVAVAAAIGIGAAMLARAGRVPPEVAARERLLHHVEAAVVGRAASTQP